MKILKNNKDRVIISQFALIFIIVLIFNSYTYYYADDYTYMYNFANGEEFDKVTDFFSSIVYHTKNVNGRFLPHFFAQILLNLPKAVFNIINSAIYVLQIYLCYRIAVDKEHYILLPAGLFCALFIFEPMFGEVNLWITGSCNYLWGITINLLYILFYIRMVRGNESRINVIPFSIFCFIAGAYIESISPGGIFISFLLIVYAKILKKQKINIKYYIGFIMAVLGFAMLVLNPVQLRHTAGSFSLYSILNGFADCIELIKGYTVLYVVFLALMVVALNTGADKDAVAISVVIFMGSVFSTCMLAFASSIPGRALCFTLVLLVCANGIILFEVLKHGNRIIADVLCIALIPTMFFSLVSGLKDVHKTYYTTMQAVKYVNDCKNDGIMVVEFPKIEGETTYSVYYDDSIYQIRESKEQMPNIYMAKFFGVEGVIGTSIDNIPEIIQDYS